MVEVRVNYVGLHLCVASYVLVGTLVFVQDVGKRKLRKICSEISPKFNFYCMKPNYMYLDLAYHKFYLLAQNFKSSWVLGKSISSIHKE